MEILLCLGVNIIFALAAGQVYHNKGRSYASGFLVGLIFGIIGLILALISPADVATQERRAIESGQSKRCHQCMKLVHVAATVCPHCRGDLAGPLAAPPAAPPAQGGASEKGMIQ